MNPTGTGIENIMKNKELGDLFNNLIKSINQNIEQTIDTDTDDVDDSPKQSNNENISVNKSDTETFTLLDTLSLIFVDKNGKNIADILTDINQNLSVIAENHNKK